MMKIKFLQIMRLYVLSIILGVMLATGLTSELKISANPLPAASSVELMSLFNNDMVIQRDKPIKIWGTYQGDASGVSISVSFGGAVKMATAKSGEWSVSFDAQPANKNGQTITVSSGSFSKAITNVLIGDVWLASGQSNIATTVSNYLSVRKDYLAIASNNNIRIFNVPKNESTTPLKEFTNSQSTVWSIPSASAVLSYSAYGYAFAYYLQKGIDIPLGIIDSSFNGTKIQHWLSAEALSAAGTAFDKSMYNAMINPLIGANIKGILWYQGESNVELMFTYKSLFENYAKSYRSIFGDSNLPIITTQLPKFDAPYFPAWPSFRFLQWNIAQADPNTYMVCGIDFGYPSKELHPYDKLPFGKRAAELALNAVYSKNTPGESPYPESATVYGNKVVIKFANAQSGLEFRNGAVNELFLMKENNAQVKATATIKGNTIEVVADGVDNPKGVSYAMTAVPNVNFYSLNGLPVVPFLLTELTVSQTSSKANSGSGTKSDTANGNSSQNTSSNHISDTEGSSIDSVSRSSVNDVISSSPKTSPKGSLKTIIFVLIFVVLAAVGVLIAFLYRKKGK